MPSLLLRFYLLGFYSYLKHYSFLAETLRFRHFFVRSFEKSLLLPLFNQQCISFKNIGEINLPTNLRTNYYLTSPTHWSTIARNGNSTLLLSQRHLHLRQGKYTPYKWALSSAFLLSGWLFFIEVPKPTDI